MDEGQSFNFMKHFNNRPTSLKVELLSIPETNSARNSYVQQDVSIGEHLGFRNLSYSVKEGLFKRKNKQVLYDVNGGFLAGEVTAIMGPSGAGKSTLMNILAGYTTHGISGELLVDSKIRNEDLFRKQSCYIMQDDNLQPLLTVKEAMSVAACLKLGPDVTKEERQTRIDEILKALGLWQCRLIKTKSLSGGQRKRLAIALELLKNPQIMFFDEPTSGLDSVSTKQCILLLKQLAQEGRTIIITIHQPSASICEMLDHLYVLAEGKCMYQGSVKGVVPYLQESNLFCPAYHNPADYLIEVAAGEHGEYVDLLVSRMGNGTNHDWRKMQVGNESGMQSIEAIDKMMRNGLVTPVRSPTSPGFRWLDNTKRKAKTDICYDDHYTASFLNQLYVLLKRTFLVLSRNKTLTISRIGTHLCIALILGILYFGIGRDASNMLNNFNFIFFSVMFLMLTAMNCVITTFPSEMPIIITEHFNRWYSLLSYYLAITIADIPIQTIATALYALITYFMTAQPVELLRIFLFFNMCILISAVAQSLGLLVGALMDLKLARILLSMDWWYSDMMDCNLNFDQSYKNATDPPVCFCQMKSKTPWNNGVIFGPFFLLPFTIFSGFFVQLYDVHPYMRWIFHISYIKYGFEGLMLAIFGYDREKMPCNADYCNYHYPKIFLEDVDMADAVYSYSVIFLLGLIVFLRVLAFIALYLRIQLRR